MILVSILPVVLMMNQLKKAYRKLQVDKMPIIEKLDKSLLAEYYSKYSKHGKELKPAKHCDNTKGRVPNTLTCPHCNAPHQYLYNNTSGRGQFKCKVCSAIFNFKNRYSKYVINQVPVLC